ncbi:RNA polymerase sigma factor SigJ [Paenibacillus sp. J5C_2022]|uniref:RNA polymerase sigma factor SigJ n=1 Tax=Paenibacillus sp. J5C2022 TaxID=2977129 RepID=UPI0021CE3959|nr:RNA polymerase sigma factor SigJ [Paenibacillus sp. J5C2022]MCU6710663.1 RNA polymerase sigma factor SigJ [Paenibacillus sp. J5C2022]
MEKDVPVREDWLTQWYGEHRRYLLAVAYRMLGSYTEAEDIVQDVFVRLHSLNPADISQARPFLTRMIVNRSMDVLKSARMKRVNYVGPWLPEPEVARYPEDVSDTLVHTEAVSYALLVMMERLSPGERAVFLLHDIMGYSYPDIAAMLERTEASCRQLMSRARKKLQSDRPQDPPPLPEARLMSERFLRAVYSGDHEQVLQWLHQQAVCFSDGGGKVHAAVRPIAGADRVAAFIIGLMSQLQSSQVADATLVPLIINGELGFGVSEGGRWTTAISIAWSPEGIRYLYMVRNPDKLGQMP